MEWHDKRLKYIELPKQFEFMANDVDITSKQHLRICEQFAKQLAGRKPKNAVEFEKIEAMKDFIVKTADLNEKTIQLIEFIKAMLQEIAGDMNLCLSDANTTTRLKDQSETIISLMEQRDKLINEIYGHRKDQR